MVARKQKKAGKRPEARTARKMARKPLREPAPATPARAPDRIDGRARRATGRTLRFGATVHPDWKAKLDQLADRLGAGTLYVRVLERALDALERELDEEETVPPARGKARRAGRRQG